jgi:mono/diheme cytochrome c family protein
MSHKDWYVDSWQLLRILAVLTAMLAFGGCREQKKPEPVHVENPARGEFLFKSVGCATCHSMNGDSRYGPPLNSIFGKEVVVIRNGSEAKVTVDRQYLIRSLQDPGAEKVLNFQKRKMPPLNLTPEEINCLVDYIISVNKSQLPKATGK